MTATAGSLPLSDIDRAAALQRRQVQLAVAAAGLFTLTLVLIGVALWTGANEPVRYVFIPGQDRVKAIVGGTTATIVAIWSAVVAAVALLAVLVVHALRVATFALRKEVR